MTSDHQSSSFKPNKFRKVLYIQQKYPQNYVPPSFLSSMIVNYDIAPELPLYRLCLYTMPLLIHIAIFAIWIACFYSLQSTFFLFIWSSASNPSFLSTSRVSEPPIHFWTSLSSLPPIFTCPHNSISIPFPPLQVTLWNYRTPVWFTLELPATPIGHALCWFQHIFVTKFTWFAMGVCSLCITASILGLTVYTAFRTRSLAKNAVIAPPEWRKYIKTVCAGIGLLFIMAPFITNCMYYIQFNDSIISILLYLIGIFSCVSFLSNDFSDLFSPHRLVISSKQLIQFASQTLPLSSSSPLSPATKNNESPVSTISNLDAQTSVKQPQQHQKSPQQNSQASTTTPVTMLTPENNPSSSNTPTNTNSTIFSLNSTPQHPISSYVHIHTHMNEKDIYDKLNTFSPYLSRASSPTMTTTLVQDASSDNQIDLPEVSSRFNKLIVPNSDVSPSPSRLELSPISASSSRDQSCLPLHHNSSISTLSQTNQWPTDHVNIFMPFLTLPPEFRSVFQFHIFIAFFALLALSQSLTTHQILPHSPSDIIHPIVSKSVSTTTFRYLISSDDAFLFLLFSVLWLSSGEAMHFFLATLSHVERYQTEQQQRQQQQRQHQQPPSAPKSSIPTPIPLSISQNEPWSWLYALYIAYGACLIVLSIITLTMHSPVQTYALVLIYIIVGLISPFSFWYIRGLPGSKRVVRGPWDYDDEFEVGRDNI